MSLCSIACAASIHLPGKPKCHSNKPAILELFNDGKFTVHFNGGKRTLTFQCQEVENVLREEDGIPDIFMLLRNGTSCCFSFCGDEGFHEFHDFVSVVPREISIAASPPSSDSPEIGITTELPFEDVNFNMTRLFSSADVVFILAHKHLYFKSSVLLKESPSFFKILSSKLNESGQIKEIALENYRYREVKLLLKLLKLKPDLCHELPWTSRAGRLLKLAEEFGFRRIASLCEHFLMQTWKAHEKMVIGAVEASAKFGLQKPLVDVLKKGKPSYPCVSAKFSLETSLLQLLNDSKADRCTIREANVEFLLRLSVQYSLSKVQELCERYVIKHWPRWMEKSLRALELSRELNLPDLADAFAWVHTKIAKQKGSIEYVCTRLHGFSLAYFGGAVSTFCYQCSDFRSSENCSDVRSSEFACDCPASRLAEKSLDKLFRRTNTLL